MSTRRLNLARRPFVNNRPIQRLAMVLWTVGLALTVVSSVLYFRHYSGTRASRERQTEIRERIAAEERAIGELTERIAGIDVPEQNRTARFVNRRISERTFSWSALFDRLSEVLPNDVRLTTLTPEFYEERRRGSGGQEARQDEILLEIRGSARQDGALLEFVDRLFAHPLFRRPDLSFESKREGGLYDYQLTVLYRPAQPEPAAEPEAAGSGEEATAAGDAGEAGDPATAPPAGAVEAESEP